MNHTIRMACVGLISILLAACATGYTKIAPQVPVGAKQLGPSSATACGTLGIGPTAYNFIPMRLNSRIERAYEEAVAAVPGATALADVTVQENWYWWALGTTRCLTISGVAVQ